MAEFNSEVLKQHFGTVNVYRILEVSKVATHGRIRDAFLNKSLLVHPDITGESTKFNLLCMIYKILADEDKRSLYDKKGICDGLISDLDENWSQYWRDTFPEITELNIKDFELKYKGSSVELYDLKQAVLTYSGRIRTVVKNMKFGTKYEVKRYFELLRDLMEFGDLPAFGRLSSKRKYSYSEPKLTDRRGRLNFNGFKTMPRTEVSDEAGPLNFKGFKMEEDEIDDNVYDNPIQVINSIIYQKAYPLNRIVLVELINKLEEDCKMS